MQEVAAGVSMAASIAAMIAQGESTKLKIEEGIADYTSEIARMKEMRDARLGNMTAEIARTKNIGINTLTETARQAKYNTQMESLKATQTASSAEAKIGASGVKSTGTALMAAQQETDIAYAAADRTAQAGAANVKIGGLQLGDTLQTQAGQKSLLSLEYKQSIAEQTRKKKELEKNKNKMVGWAYAGGLAGVASSFYNVFGE